jgi:hypothetical protein
LASGENILSTWFHDGSSIRIEAFRFPSFEASQATSYQQKNIIEICNQSYWSGWEEEREKALISRKRIYPRSNNLRINKKIPYYLVMYMFTKELF